jgi:hypothetical protein
LQAFLPSTDLSMFRCHNPNSAFFLIRTEIPPKSIHLVVWFEWTGIPHLRNSFLCVLVASWCKCWYYLFSVGWNSIAYKWDRGSVVRTQRAYWSTPFVRFNYGHTESQYNTSYPLPSTDHLV